MRTKLAILAVAALLALSMGSVTAAMDTTTADTTSDDVLPANYTVDITNSGEVRDEAVDQAIETTWTNQTVRNHFDEGAAVHFEVWASRLDADVIHIKVAPIDEPDETRVIADVDLSEQRITSVDEPVKLTASNAVSINASDYDIKKIENSNNGSDGTNTTRLTADQAVSIQLNESSIEHGDDGTFTFEVDDGNEITTVASDRVIEINSPPETQTDAGE